MEQWIGLAIGRMHVFHVTQKQIAKKLGVTTYWVNLIMNGKRCPKNAESRITKAIDDIIIEKGAN